MVLIAEFNSQKCSCSSANRDEFENNTAKFNFLPDCMCHAFEIFYHAILFPCVIADGFFPVYFKPRCMQCAHGLKTKNDSLGNYIFLYINRPTYGFTTHLITLLSTETRNLKASNNKTRNHIISLNCVLSTN